MSEEQTCAICGEPAGDSALALCGICDRAFHLHQRNDTAGKDCGDVWIDEQFLSLRYACFDCLGKSGKREPPVGSGH